MLPYPLKNLAQVIYQQLLPLIPQPEFKIFLTPHRSKQLPRGISLEEKPILGPSMQVRNRRPVSQLSPITKIWPNDNLCTKNDPFLVFPLGNNIKMQIGHQLFRSDGKTLFFIPPDLPHPTGEYGSALHGTGSILWMRESGHGLRCWITHLYDGKAWFSRSGESFYFVEMQTTQTFSILCQELMTQNDPDIIRHASFLFFYALQRDLKNKRAFMISSHNTSHFGTFTHPLGKPDSIEMACQYIRSNLSAPLTTESVAKKVYMSRSNFAKKFREKVGKPFHQYLQEHRLIQAKMFLCETDWTVRTISEICGFVSYSSFNQFFLKQTGYTPHKYRQEKSTSSSAKNTGRKNNTLDDLGVIRAQE